MDPADFMDNLPRACSEVDRSDIVEPHATETEGNIAGDIKDEEDLDFDQRSRDRATSTIKAEESVLAEGQSSIRFYA